MIFNNKKIKINDIIVVKRDYKDYIHKNIIGYKAVVIDCINYYGKNIFVIKFFNDVYSYFRLYKYKNEEDCIIIGEDIYKKCFKKV